MQLAIQQLLMELQIFKAMWEHLSMNNHLAKTFQSLTRIRQVQQQSRKPQAKDVREGAKLKCQICCAAKYDHVLMLIIHIEILHPEYVQKYYIKGESLTIIEAGRIPVGEVGQGFLQPIKQVGMQAPRQGGQGFYLRSRLETRVGELLIGVAGKLERELHGQEQIYLHSTDIFRQIGPEHMAVDSEDELGEVEKELEKLRIEDFGDVNANDKRFFIEWNGFIHLKRKELEVIFSFQIPTLFKQFCALLRIQGRPVPRINLVMHAWTLWSSGQITSRDVIAGLSEFDGQAPTDT